MGVIFALLCYIWYLKKPCETWCSLYENCSNVYDCCTWCCSAFDESENKKERDIEMEKKRREYRLKKLEEEVKMYKHNQNMFRFKCDEDDDLDEYCDTTDLDKETNQNQNNIKLDIYPKHAKNERKTIML